ncbi:hypothetical protein DRO24_01915 [Candidatus Bathyarchaeota archaeon]|nr:MAG: hypothetical protein DRO24_01915 [Candidatus Bathyarchaeota archaeon]
MEQKPNIKNMGKPKPKPKVDATANLTIADLQRAIDVINQFTSIYRRATMAVKSLERAQGLAGSNLKGSMLGGIAQDPFTAMMMPVMEQAIQEQAKKIVEKRMGKMEAEIPDEEMQEAMEGLEDETEETETEEEGEQA